MASSDDNKKQSGLLDWLSWAFGEIGDIFSLLFWGALILGGAYFLMQVPAVRDFMEENLPGVALALNSLTGGRLFAGMLEKKLDGLKTADEVREQLGDYVPKEFLDVLDKDIDTWKTYYAMVKSANATYDPKDTKHATNTHTLVQDDFLNANTLYAILMSKDAKVNAQTVRNLILAGKKLQAAGSSDSNVAAAMAGVAGIVKDKKRLNDILHFQPAYDAVMFGLESFSPFPVKPGALAHFIDTTGRDGNGDATPALQKFLSDMVAVAGGSANAGDLTRKALVTYIASSPQVTPESVVTLAKSIDASKMSQADQAAFTMLADPNNANLLVNIAHGSGPDKALEVIDTLQKGYAQGGRAGAINAVLSNPATQGALSSISTGNPLVDDAMKDPQFKGAFNYLGQHGVDCSPLVLSMLDSKDPKKSADDTLTFVLKNSAPLLQGQNAGALGVLVSFAAAHTQGAQQQALNFVGAMTPNTKGQQSYANIVALATTVNKLAVINGQNDIDSKSAGYVLHAVAMLGVSQPDEALTLLIQPQALNHFFANTDNRKAIGQLLSTLNASRDKLDARSGAVLDLFTKHWDTIGTALTDPNQSIALGLMGAAATGHPDALKELTGLPPEAVAAFFKKKDNLSLLNDTADLVAKYPNPNDQRTIDALALFTKHRDTLYAALSNPEQIGAAELAFQGKVVEAIATLPPQHVAAFFQNKANVALLNDSADLMAKYRDPKDTQTGLALDFFTKHRDTICADLADPEKATVLQLVLKHKYIEAMTALPPQHVAAFFQDKANVALLNDTVGLLAQSTDQKDARTGAELGLFIKHRDTIFAAMRNPEQAGALRNILQGHPEALATLPPQHVAAFFQNGRNAALAGDALNVLAQYPDGLSKTSTEAVQLVAPRFPTLLPLLRDPAKVKTALDIVNSSLTTKGKPDAKAQAQDMQAAIDFAKVVMRDPNDHHSIEVLTAFAALATGDKDKDNAVEFRNLPAAELQAFFHDPANKKAINTLLKHLDPKGLQLSAAGQEELKIAKEITPRLAEMLGNGDPEGKSIDMIKLLQRQTDPNIHWYNSYSFWKDVAVYGEVGGYGPHHVTREYADVLDGLAKIRDLQNGGTPTAQAGPANNLPPSKPSRI